MKRAGCLWVLLLIAQWVEAQYYPQTIILSPFRSDGPGEIALQGNLYHLADSTGQLPIGLIVDRQRAGQFQRSVSPTSRQDFGLNQTAAHWLFWELVAPVSTAPTTRLMLQIEYANIDELELWAVQGTTVRRLGRAGNRFFSDQRPYPNNNWVFPITLRAGERVGYYLRVRQPYAILSFFVRLWHRPAFVATDRTEYLTWGIFIGIICIILVLNFVLLVALRDWIYAWYNGFVHFMTMHLFTDSGLSFQYLWGTYPHLNQFLLVYLYVWAAMICQTTFMQYFIHQNRHNSRVFWWLSVFKGLVTLVLGIALAIPILKPTGYETYYYRLVSVSTSLFVPIITVLTIVSLIEASRRARVERMVRFYSYALLMQFTGYMAAAVINFCQAQGWALPFNVETYVILGTTLLTDLIFFTFGLTYRYRQGKERNQQLELDLLAKRQEAQQQVISSLEDEHRRLAQDLHDDVGPLLATTKGYLSRLFRTDPTPLLQRAQALIDEAANELRTLAHQLLPRQLEAMDLPEAMAEATRKASNRGVPVQYVGLGVVRPLGRQHEQLLFSIATQLIRNAQKRPQATEVTVQLLYHEEQVTLSVEDDGVGNPPTEADEANLRAKADLLKAELLIDATQSGNSVIVSLLTTQPTPV